MIKFLITFLLLFKRVELSDISFYEILGVTKQASTQEIRHAYKKLAVKFHPDKNADLQDQSKFIKITEAYEILKDPIKRQNYDLYGSQLSYTRKYDYHSETEYNNLYYNGLYNNDPFVESVSEKTFYSYLNDGFHFINFYSPFCPPCQNLVDHWKKLAQKYNGIVKVGAVNCKYHNSFCFNTMRIGSYPTLLFYPNGKDGNYLKYGGDRTLDSFDQFIMSYLKNQVHIATVSQIQSTNKPIAYVLGTKRIDKNALIRIAYHLKNLLSVLIVKDDTLRETLSKNEYATVVFKYKDVSKHIESTEEDVVLAEIVNSLPEIDLIGPDKLKDIRNQLRRGSNIPWVLYFTNANSDRLILHQMKMEFPDIHFGEVDCERWGEVCASLQVSVGAGGAWGVLKAGGAFERAPPAALPRRFLPAALAATNLHSLSASDFNNILSGDAGKWVLLVVPHQVSLSHISELFTQTSLHFITSLDISFGIMACTQNNNNNCRSFAHNQPAVVLQDGRERHFYSGRIEIKNLKEFIKLLLDSKDVQLDEQDMLDIMEPSTRQYSWLVAYFPSGCGRKCDDLAHQWRLVADKLTALEDVRVGLLRCSADGALCSNVRVPAARLYPAYTPHHHTVSLEQMLLAPYILEWALGHIDGSVVQLDWNTFSKLVIAEELNPSSDKKPWLVYFHSPRCYRCYELYPDFALTGMFLKNAVNLGKVNCLSERGVCQHERITAYPSLKLYRPRLATINLHPTDHEQLVHDIQPHLAEYKQYSINLDNLEVHTRAFNVKHDEF